jgi:hypothetical protein
MKKEELLKKYYNLHEEEKYYPKDYKRTFSNSQKARRNYILAKHDKMLKDLPYGLEIEDGWLKIVDYVCSEFKDIMTLRQIKQKFGTLRIYYSLKCEDDLVRVEQIEEIIRELEQLSSYICELTGLEGNIIKGKHGYYMTLNSKLARKFVEGTSIEDLKDFIDIQERLKELEKITYTLKNELNISG